MTNQKRLSIALENLLREMKPDELKALCSDTIDSLVKSLPKERGGSKVVFEGRTRGRSGVAPSGGVAARKKAIGTMGVRKGPR